MVTIGPPLRFRGRPVVVDYAPGVPNPAAIQAAILDLLAGVELTNTGLHDLFARIEATIGFHGCTSHVTGFSPTSIEIVVEAGPGRNVSSRSSEDF